MGVYQKAIANACEGKKVYNSKKSAKRHAGRLANIKGHGKLRAYHCVFCSKYHLGHPAPQKALIITKDNVSKFRIEPPGRRY